MKVVAIVPARYNSSRFMGKPLADIGGRPMIWHVCEAARRVKEIDEICVATEDQRIADACAGFGVRCLLTSAEHLTGTDRLAECIDRLEGDLFVNVQGDEPLIASEAIAAVTIAMQENTDSQIVATNGFTRIHSASDVVNTNVVKVTRTMDGRALSYSRSAIPFPKNDEAVYLRQLGLYCFSRKGLELFRSLPPGPVERCESIEMLRFIENGHDVMMVEVSDDSVPVDTEFDLRKVRALYAKLHGPAA